MKNYASKILITGGDSQLACAILQHSHANQFRIQACNHYDLDVTNIAAIYTALDKYKPDIIINTAAYTAVDKAETDKVKAIQVNHLGCKNLAIACKQYHIPLFHISTDYVFDGNKTTPYHENDATNPLNVYGESKWLGEQAIREYGDKYLILRVSAVFSEYGNNFLKRLLRFAKERHELRIVNDQTTAPTYAGDIAYAIFTLAKRPIHAGTYHFCSQNETSWYEFANAILNQAKKHIPLPINDIQAIPAKDYLAAAKRPAYSVLNCKNIHEDFGISQPTWVEPMQTVVQKLLT